MTQTPLNLHTGEAERGAVHEAGHIVVGLSLGVTVEKVSRVEGNDLPEVLREIGFESSAATDFSKSIHEIEPRRQFLIAVGGMAAETLKFGFYDKKGCAHDIDAMKPNILTEDEVKGLIEIAQLMLLPNLSIFNYVKEELYQWSNISGAAPVLGDKFNQRFRKGHQGRDNRTSGQGSTTRLMPSSNR
jgi:hypothetical protein